MPLLPFFQKNAIEAGCDEAGRGCLAGPVVAAAVILPPSFDADLLNDSKKMSEKHRYQLREVIEEKAVTWAVAYINHEKIDEINILNASILAMHKALEQLTIQPTLILVDGNKFKPYNDIVHHCIIKGDGKYQSIAAASVLAKTYRDDYMKQLHQQYPIYQWKNNKGYPTKAHRTAIATHGVSPFHRLSFKLLPDAEKQLNLFEN